MASRAIIIHFDIDDPTEPVTLDLGGTPPLIAKAVLDRAGEALYMSKDTPVKIVHNDEVLEDITDWSEMFGNDE